MHVKIIYTFKTAVANSIPLVSNSLYMPVECKAPKQMLQKRTMIYHVVKRYYYFEP